MSGYAWTATRVCATCAMFSPPTSPSLPPLASSGGAMSPRTARAA